MAADTLQSYLNDTRRLLHDALAKYWTDADLIVAINKACRRAVADSTCYRTLQTVYLSGNLELYSYGMTTGANVTSVGSGYTSTPAVVFAAPTTAGGVTATGVAIVTNGTVTQIQVTNGGSGYTSAPAVTFTGGGGTGAAATASILDPNTMDVLNVTVLWGNVRVTLDVMSFTQFQATVRAWTGYTQRPGCRAVYGQSQHYIGPIPDQFYVTEWDTTIVPPDLVNYTDTSVVLYPYSEAVPYYAAHVAKFEEQSYNDSDRYIGLYQRKMQYAIRARMMRMLPSSYQAP